MPSTNLKDAQFTKSRVFSPQPERGTRARPTRDALPPSVQYKRKPSLQDLLHKTSKEENLRRSGL